MMETPLFIPALSSSGLQSLGIPRELAGRTLRLPFSLRSANIHAVTSSR